MCDSIHARHQRVMRGMQRFLAIKKVVGDCLPSDMGFSVCTPPSCPIRCGSRVSALECPRDVEQATLLDGMMAAREAQNILSYHLDTI